MKDRCCRGMSCHCKVIHTCLLSVRVLDIEALMSASCSIISMPAWSFRRGILGFVEATETRCVVSRTIQGLEVSIMILASR